MSPDTTTKTTKQAAWGDSPFVDLAPWVHDRLRRRLEYLDAIDALTLDKATSGPLARVPAVEDVDRAARAARYAELSAAADRLFGARS